MSWPRCGRAMPPQDVEAALMQREENEILRQKINEIGAAIIRAASELRRDRAEKMTSRRTRRRGGYTLPKRPQRPWPFRWPRRPCSIRELRHQRVGNLEIGIDVLHVVIVFEHADEAQNFFARFIVDADRIVRLPDQARLAWLAEFRLRALARPRAGFRSW